MTDQDRLSTLLKEVVPEPPPRPARAAAARARARRARRTRRVVGATAAVAAVAVAVPWALSLGDHPAPPAGTAPSAGWSPYDPLTCTGAGCVPRKVRAAIRKPLRLPSLTEKGYCPVTTAQSTFPDGVEGFSGSVTGVGAGPLYVVGLGRRASRLDAELLMSRAPGGGLEQKVIWLFAKDYAGPLLLRGGRIDGDGSLGFLRYVDAAGYHGGSGDGPESSLLYVRGGLDAPTPHNLGITSAPSALFVDSPGCYAIQVDGEGFSEKIVFRAVAP